MTPCTTPSATVRSIPDRAANPPNRFERPAISSSKTTSLGRAERYEAACGQPSIDIPADAARHVHHCQHDDHAEDDKLVLVIGAGPLGDKGNQYRADDTAPDVTKATGHHHQDHRHHAREVVVVWVNKAGRHMRREAAGTAGVERTDDKGEQFVLPDV